MKRHISIFAFLLGAFAAVGPLAAHSALQFYTYGIQNPLGDKVDSTLAESYFSPLVQRQIIVPDLPLTVSVNTGTPGWAIDCWLKQFFKLLGDYREDAWERLDEGVSDDKSKYTFNDTDMVRYTNGWFYVAVKFRHITYNLAYDSAGGTPTPTGWTYSYDTQFQIAAAPSRTGYTFGGWRASSVGGTFAAGETVSGTNLCPDTWHEDGSNVTMIAQWTSHTYKVHFDGNGETSGSMEDQSFTYDEDAKELSANAFGKENYVFAGWATNATLGGIVYQDREKVQNLTTNDNATVNLYARWTQMHEVTFRDPVGFGGRELKVEYVKDGEDAHPPSDPGYKGFTLAGWDRDYHKVTSDLTVTAVYEGKMYWVVYHANGGSGDDPKRESFQHGKKIKLAPANTFSRTGYTLEGWMTNVTATAADYKCEEEVLDPTLEDSFNLYAFWKPISYIVAFDGNGGEGTMEPIPLDYGVPFGVPECKFTKTGCEFKSWQVLINKVVVTNYPAGVTVSNLTSKAGDTVTFRADWIGRYAVAFDGNGGEGEMTNVTYETGVEYALPSNAFAKTGYGFYGWATSKADADALRKPAYTNGQTVVDLADPGETLPLFAEWTTNRYTVVFNPGGATGTMPDQAFIYDQPQALRDCTFNRGDPALWSFAGWTNSAAGGPLYANHQMVSNLTAQADGRVELTAVWNSELSDLARAMGCDNLNWTDSAGKWFATTDEWTDGSTISCVRADADGASMNSSAITTNGVLHFWWKATGERLSVQCLYPGGQSFSYRLDDGYPYDVWNETNIVVELTHLKGDSTFLSFLHRKNGTCYIAKMTWTPEGAHPEPLDGKDNVTINSAAVSDGKFILSFTSDARFDYNLLTNANLLINGWGIMETQVGNGNILTFEPEIIEGQSQLFYKVETIKRED